MKGQAVPYLMFNGNCLEALEFYKTAFGGEISHVQTYEQAGYKIPGAENLLIHARFQKDDLSIMASDASPGSSIVAGNQISLVLDFESEEEIQSVYDVLSKNGAVQMELQDTFWGAKYGKVKDDYGVIWDLNYQK
ncbi:VOC family protein [Neobacillus muris]|uniref:VOC family protein n=1 Tax=Neobacillus muris TaxID=2941334 RepID=UPI00203F4165|nr:VOC family protein [Neobacillus muris]